MDGWMDRQLSPTNRAYSTAAPVRLMLPCHKLPHGDCKVTTHFYIQSIYADMCYCEGDSVNFGSEVIRLHCYLQYNTSYAEMFPQPKLSCLCTQTQNLIPSITNGPFLDSYCSLFKWCADDVVLKYAPPDLKHALKAQKSCSWVFCCLGICPVVDSLIGCPCINPWLYGKAFI